MADALTEIDIGQLHTVMVETIQAAFPSLQTVEFYRDERISSITTPACLLELVEMETAGAEPDPGTEQLAVSARFEAQFILGFHTANVKLEARKLAGAFAAFLRKQSRWSGVVTGPAEVVGCYRDEFNPDLDQYEVWRVEWSHILHLGESVWKPEGMTPTVVYLSSPPDIGTNNEDKYEQVYP